MREMQPLRELGTVLFDMSGPTPFVGVQTGFDPLFPRNQLRAYWKALHLKGLDDEAIDAIAASALDRPAPQTLLNTFHMGGAIADVRPEDTAFPERSAPYLVSIDGHWTDAGDDADNVAWVRSTFAQLEEFGTGSVYLNFTGSRTSRRAPVSTARSAATSRGSPSTRRRTTRTTSSTATTTSRRLAREAGADEHHRTPTKTTHLPDDA
jgi:hypothetical protein